MDRAVSGLLGWPPVLVQLLAPIRPYLLDPDVTDILIDGADVVRVERLGAARSVAPVRFESPRELESVVRFLAQGGDAQAGHGHVSVQLPDGSRVHAILGELAHCGRGPWISIRRFRRAHLGPEDLVRVGAIPADVLDGVVGDLVEKHWNVVVSGPTGSGKTTLAEVLLRALPPSERVLVLQDVEEVVAPSPQHAWGSFRPGAGGYDALLASLLRMMPDRLVLGEVRGPEAWTLLEALTTGHSGGVTTLHAATPRLALRRLESLALQHRDAPEPRAIRARVAEAVQLVVQTERRIVGEATWRGVSRVAVVEGMDERGEIIVRDRWVADHTPASSGHPR